MEKKSKKTIIIGITCLLLVTLILIGLTYAYYRTRIVGNSNDTSINVISKTLEVTYVDGSATLSTDGRIEPGFTATKTFSVKNTGDDAVSYSVILDNVVNEFNKDTTRGEYNDWEYYLYSGTEVNDDNLIKSGDITTDSLQVLLYSVSIASGETLDYILVLEYVNLSDVDQSADMGSNFSLRVNIDEKKADTLANTILSDNVVTTPLTTPGQAVSLASEAVLAETPDNFTATTGTNSYYFRGAVENNYVNFAGMCWRIVRIQGDGTVKLILADEDNECNGSGYSATNTGSAFINDGTVYGGPNNSGDNFFDYSLSFTGWDYSIIETWAISKGLAVKSDDIVTYDESIELNSWCDDNGISRQTDYDIYYAANDRLSPSTSASPSIECDGGSIFTKYIAFLTADEVAFAGGTTYITNWPTNTYYLNTNANIDGISYPTISPATDLATSLGDSGYCIFLVNGSNGYLYTSPMIIFGEADTVIRPSIVIKSDVKVSESVDKQNGTLAYPYVIE